MHLGRLSYSRLDLEELLSHVVVHQPVVPDAHPDGNCADKDGLRAADIRKEVQQSVALSEKNVLVQVHLDCDVHLHILVQLLRLVRKFVQPESLTVLHLCEIVEVDQIILQEQHHPRNAIGDRLEPLRVDRLPD